MNKKMCFVVLGLLFFCFSFITFCQLNKNSVHIGQENTNNLGSFLQFENAIMELNNKNQNQLKALSSGLSEFNQNMQGEFALKRLIVQGNISDTYGATKKISYNNLHILCYSSEQATKKAFEQLSLNSSLDVMVDKQESLSKYAEKDYIYTSYINWGAKSADIGGYRQFLVDKNVNKEIVVVVLDTGINTSHSMFSNRLLKDKYGKIKGYSYYNSNYQYSYNNLSFDIDDPETTDIDEGDANKYSFEDDEGHGTHVAGIICNLTPSNVKILPIKIGNANGKSTSSIVLSAYLRVINIYSNQYNIVCTNLSFSGAGKSSESERDTYNTQCYEPLMNLNILPITAAGNEYDVIDIDGLKAVVVSALKEQNGQYVFDNSYSNYGNIVDISAPGTNVLSAGISETDGASSITEYNTGTSMASPQVAGIVALLYLNPDYAGFTAADIEQILYDCSLDAGVSGKDIYYGHGMLNIKYFETKNVSETLCFYRNGGLVSEHIENENFDETFTLSIKCSNSDYEIIYTTNKQVPTLSNSIKYSSSINVNSSLYIYAMGVKMSGGQIIARTNLFNISYFYSLTPLENCFTVNGSQLSNYTGNFTNLTIPSTLKGKTITSLAPSLFKNSNLKSITLASTITQIGGYAFQYCYDLQYVYAPNVSLLYLASFSNCNSLTKVLDTHPTSQDKVGVFLPNLTTTSGFAFSLCENLESVRLSKLTNLGTRGYDFQACTNLKSVYIPNITSIPDATFKFCENLTGTFEIGKDVTTIGKSAFVNTKLKKFIVNANNKNFYTDSYGLYTKNAIIAFACGNENIDYSILSKVAIGGITYTITTIDQSALSYAKFNKLIVPEPITLIKEWAVDDTSINYLYYNATNCSSDGYYYNGMFQPFGKISTIEIGANVQQVPKKLFQGADFSELIINSSSTTINSSCFYNTKDKMVTNSVTFNFNNKVESSYLKSFSESNIFSNRAITYIYSKTELPVGSVYSFSKYKYSIFDNGYYIYSESPLINEYTITSSANEFGLITPAGERTFVEGDSPKYIFTPYRGYHVESIMVDGVALSGNDLENAIKNGYTFANINSNHTISVIFSLTTYTITYKDCDDNVLSENLTPKTYTYGTSIYLPTNVQRIGYTFAGWYDNVQCEGTATTKISSTDYGNKTYYAKFVINTYSVLVQQVQFGVISYAQNKYNYGENAHFTITPNVGYHVEYLLIDGNIYTKSLNEYTFEKISQNHAISAYFAPNDDTKYCVKHWQESLTESGDILVGTKYYNLILEDTSKTGTTAEYTQASFNNYEGFTAQTFNQDKILGDGSTIINILYNRNKYNLHLINGDGISNVFGEGEYLYGQTVELNATVIDGYDWYSWVSSDTNIILGSLNKEYRFIMPAGEISLTANAKLKEFLITIINPQNGKINPESSQLFSCGFNLELEFKADLNYELSKLLIDGNDVTSQVIENKYILSNITSDHTVEAVFDLVSYNIESSVIGNGIIESDLAIVKHGSNPKYMFIPNTGYKVKDVKIDDVSVGAVEYYVFVNINKEHTISVEFEAKSFNIGLFVDGEGNIFNDKPLNNVIFGENRVLTFEPKDGWHLHKVYINCIPVVVSDNQLVISDIVDDINIQVIFEQTEIISNSGTNVTTIMVIVFALVIAGLLIVLFLKSYKNKAYVNSGGNTSNIQTEQTMEKNNQNDEIKSIQNPQLQNALNMVEMKKDNFIKFCLKYNIDYINDYNGAALRYYNAYLRSIKPPQPPKA